MDYEGPEPQPLPNLDYKIEVGDSICSPSPGALQMGLADQFIKPFSSAKERYLTAHHADKEVLRREVDELRETILGLACPGERGFVWAVDFAEVFFKGGFNIVIANPPYISGISSDKEEGYRDRVRNLYQTATGVFDIFVVFYELCHRITTAGGAVSLITPNKVLSAGYAVALRRMLLEEATVVSILDLSRALPFGAAVYPVVVTYFKRVGVPTDQVQLFRGDKKGSEYSIELQVSTELAVLATFPEDVWSPLMSERFPIYEEVFRTFPHLEDFCTVRQSASVDEAYKVFAPLLKEETTKSRKHTVKFVISGTLNRYEQLWGKKMRYLKAGYLRPILEVKSPPLNAERVHQIRSPKVIISGQALYPKAYWDEFAEYASGIPTVLVYDSTVPLGFLCAIVNSAPFADMYDILWSTLAMSGGYLRFGPPQLKRMPVPYASDTKMRMIENLVRHRQSLSLDETST